MRDTKSARAGLGNSVMDLQELWAKHDGEYIHFDRVENKQSNRPDIHAFLLLDKLVPGKLDIVRAAEHDEIYLSVRPDELEKAATEEQIIELIRCGVRFDEGVDSLAMLV